MTDPPYPTADREDIADRLHGHLVRDPYRWLEDPAQPRTRHWLAAQEELWRAHRAALPGRDSWHALVAQLSTCGVVTAPIWRRARCFFLRQGPTQQHPVLHAGDPADPADPADPDGPGAVARVLLDPATLDPAAASTLDHWQPDREGRRLTVQVSHRGDERAELSVLAAATGEVLDGPIGGCRYSPVAWLPGGSAFYYVRATGDAPGAPRRVHLHRVGTPPAADPLVFGAGQPATTGYGLGISHDGRWLTVSASDPARPGVDLWIADLSASAPEDPRWRVVHEGLDARTALNVAGDGRVYLVTDLEAPRGRLCVADPADPRPGGWRELVAAEPDAVIGDFAILDDPRLARPLLLVSWTRHAISEIGVHDLATGTRLGTVPLPGLGAVGPMSAVPGGGHEIWFTYTDWVTPAAVYRYDALAATTTPWDAPAVPEAAGRSPAGTRIPARTATRIGTRHAVAHSADGTPVRMVVLAGREGARGPRPAILYGYGGFGIPLTPTYSSFALAWVQAGGVFAAAHLRGGGEEGEQWHRDGMLERKQNVFDDFAAAARWLADGGWTTPAQLGICGESNGGLLVGATLTQHPDLVAAAVCSTPLLDMVRYERSGLGPVWTGEYGSAGDPQQLRTLLGYSPYHRVRDGVDYPAVLFTVFGGDTRVDPMHARKMCAALQGATAGTRPILLRCEDDAGHGARAAGRAVDLAADMLAFLAAHTGLAHPAEPAKTVVPAMGEPR